MIVLNVTYKCKPGMRTAFLDAIKSEGIDKCAREEAGNQKYEYYLSDSNPDEILLIEKWTDADAIEFHKAQAHFAKLGELKKEFVLDTLFDKFEK